MLNTYKIAGLTVEMDTFGKTEKQAEKFKTSYSEKYDIKVCSDFKDNELWDVYFSNDSAEYMKTAVDFYNKLLNHDGMMLHSSAVVSDGFAYLFTAPSGTGKSTHTELWCRNFEGTRILNDDKPAIRLENGRWHAYGTPWSGKSDLNLNLRVPLGGIAIIERSESNSIERIKGKKAVFSLLEQTIRPDSGVLRLKVVDLLSDLLEKVPVWLLKCNMEKEAAFVAKEAMTAVRPKNLTCEDE